MHVYFGTVNRGAPMAQGGELVWLDWDAGRVLGSIPIRAEQPDLAHDPNIRGGGRGCRGIVVLDDEVLACSYHTVYRLSRDLGRRGHFSSPLMVGLHEISTGDDGLLWLSATAVDRAIGVGPDGSAHRVLAPRSDPRFRRTLGLEPLLIDPAIDNRSLWLDNDEKADPSHLHLNAVTVRGGRVLALFNRFGIIADLTNGEILVRDAALERGHNLEILPDGTLVSVDTHGRTIRFYDADKGTLVHVADLMAHPEMRAIRRDARKVGSHKIAKPLFTRGLAIRGDIALVGTSPATILAIRWPGNELVGMYQHTDDVRVAVHGLTIAPESP